MPYLKLKQWKDRGLLGVFTAQILQVK